MNKSVHAFRQKAAIFGHNAPKWASLPAHQRYGSFYEKQDKTEAFEHPIYPTNWDFRNLAADDGGNGFVYLDSTYEGLVRNGYLILESPTAQGVFRINDVTEVSRNDFTLSSKVTRIETTKVSGHALSFFSMRNTTVHLQSETLPLAPLPILDPVDANPVSLDGPYPESTWGNASC